MQQLKRTAAVWSAYAMTITTVILRAREAVKKRTAAVSAAIEKTIAASTLRARRSRYIACKQFYSQLQAPAPHFFAPPVIALTFTIFILQYSISLAAPPNVILITIDTLRADYVSYNGSTKVKTPNIDALAARGANFQRARSAVPLTLPSHASILTALYPPSHGVRDNGAYRLDSRITTVAEVLKKHGYTTAAFAGSFVLDHRFGLDQGFDHYDDRVSTDSSKLERFEAERNAEMVRTVAVDWLRSNAGKVPLFVWIHFYDPHAPYIAPEPFRSRYSHDPYAAEVAYTDAVIGKLRNDLQSLGLLKGSVIAVVGDHGEGLGQHQETTHSLLIYNSTLHVPMFVAGSGIPAGKQISQLCRTIDLAPTLLDYLGVRKSFGEGVSLRQFIEGKSQDDLSAYSESLYPKLNLGWSELIGLETANHHYIESPNPELFEIKKDPLEELNQIKRFPAVALNHREYLRKYKKKPEGEEGASPELDAETLEKLASLGYVSGSTAAPRRSGLPIDPKEKIGIWNQIQTALFHITRQDHRKGIQLLVDILAQDKQIPLVYDYLGGAYIQMQDWSNAEKVYRQALASGVDSSNIHANLGLIHYNRKQLEQAERELQIAVTMDASNVTAHYNLGNVYRANGQHPKAIQSYQQALRINPNYVFAFNGLGMSYAALSQNDSALNSFQQAVKIDPANAPAYFNLATQLERMNHPDRAVEMYKKFLAIADRKQFTTQYKRALEAIQRLHGTSNHR